MEMTFEIDKNKELFIFFLLLLFSVFFISADAFEGIKVYDEGVTVYGASRVLDGALPYRDFWTAYMPGHFYLYALVFKIFGASLAVERVTSIIFIIAITIMAYFISRKVLPVVYALMVFFFSSVWLSSFDFWGYIIHPTLLFCLISINFFLTYLLKAKKKALIWAGIFAGITALFRHDFGFYVFGSEILILTLHEFLIKEYSNQKKIRVVARESLKIIVGTRVIFLPVAVFFLIKVPFRELYHNLIAFPLEVYPDYRSIPFPSPFISYEHFQSQFDDASFDAFVKENLDRLYIYFPLIVYFALFLQLIVKITQNTDFIKTRKFWTSASILMFGFLFYSKVIIRSVHLHLMPTYVIAIIVFFMVIANIDKTLTNKKVNRIAYVLLYLLAIPALIRPFWSESINMIYSDSRIKERLNVVRAEKIHWDLRGYSYEKVINYVDSLVPEKEKIFVGNVRHDRVFTNDVLFYFLSGRESPTKYYELHPGIVTTREVQKEIVKDIAFSGVRFVVLKEETRVETENKSGESSGITLLDDFIRNNYQLDKDFGDYSVWIKKDTSTSYIFN